MREIASTLEKGFLVGLRPEPNAPIGAEALSRCVNMIPNELGLIPRPELERLTYDSQSIRWPFPVLKALSKGLYMFNASNMYVVSGGSTSNVGGYSGSWGPEVADFGDTFLIGDSRGYMYAEGSMTDLTSRGISFRACTNYKGQAFVANGRVPNGPLKSGTTVSNGTAVEGRNLVAWSRINSLDFTFDLGNEAGYAYMPWNGEVYSLKILGDSVIVYGDNGIAKLDPVLEPVPSFGVSLFSNFGLLSPRAVAGDGQQQVFVGPDYNLYLVEPRKALSASGYAPKKLGFAEFVRQLGDQPVVSFDPVRGHWWICGPSKAFILTQQGLGESTETTTGVCLWDGKIGGISKRVGTDEAIVRTLGLSFGTRGIKLLSTIEADIESGGRAWCRVWWLSDYSKQYQSPGRIPIDPRGNCFPMISGSQFEVEVITEDFRTTKLSKLWLRYKVTDKHAVRGVVNAGKIAE